MSRITEATEIFVPRYMTLKEIYDKHERAHWVPEEADMKDDIKQWQNGTIKPEQRALIKMILRGFTQADTNVCAGYVEKLLPVFKNADARVMLLSFAARETTHMYAYKRLNDTLGYDTKEFMSEFLAYKEMKDKHEFMLEQVDLRSNKGKAEYLGKQILMEGVDLFAQFAMLLSYSTVAQLPGMVSINQWSVIEESLHVEGLTELFRIYIEENPSVITEEFKKTMYETARKVVALQDAFIDLCFDIAEPPNMTRQQAKNYVRFVCDYRMRQMGFKRQFGIEKNPCQFVEDITGETFGNFFETTITNYSKSPLTGDWIY